MYDIEKNNRQYGTTELDKLNLGSEPYEGVLNDAWDTQMRLGFIRKTYGILLFQIGITFLMCLTSMLSPSFAMFQNSNPGLFWLAIIGTIILSIC